MARLKQVAHKRSRGGASSSRCPRVPDFDEFRFTSFENSVWYEKMRGNAMIFEKSIDSRIDGGVPLRAEFNKFGWGPLLDIRGNYFPDLVWQFFANMEEKDKLGLEYIWTYVKGVRIEVTSDILAILLGVPNDGPLVVYNQYDTVTSDPDYDIFRASQRLHYRRVQTGSRKSILLTYIPLLDCPIFSFVGANIIPRKAENNEVRNMDVYLIDKMLNDLGSISAIPVASIMIAHMRFVDHSACQKNTKQHAPFTITISPILTQLGVNIEGETCLASEPRHVLNALHDRHVLCFETRYMVQKPGKLECSSTPARPTHPYCY